MLARNFTRWGAITVLLTLATIALAHPAVGILYQRTAYGDLSSTCTVSILAGEDVGMTGPVLVTAAHCVNRNLVHDPGSETWTDTADWLVTFDERTFVAAFTHRVGETTRGYDIAILTFAGQPPEGIEPLRLGDWNTVELGSRLWNYANPLGIGLQRFEGYVSMLSLERPVKGAQIWWRHHGVAIIPGAGGSSGSLLLNEDGIVVGVLVGVIQASFGTPFVIFVPVDRFAPFLENDHYGRTITY